MTAFNFNDAQAALSFVVNQATYIEREVFSIPYPEITYAQMIPVDTSAGEFSASVTFFTQDIVGKAKLMNSNADDFPLANLVRTKFEQSVLDAGIGYEFSLAEIGQAQMMGRSLPTEGAMAARLAYEQLVDAVALAGDSGIEGLYATTGITSTAAAAAWSGATAAQILADVNAIIARIVAATGGIHWPNTLVLPLSQFALIAGKQIDPTNQTTILDFVRRANAYTARTGQELTIFSDVRLTNKAVCYKRDPQVLKMHMPMPLRFLPPQMINLQVRVPGMFRFAPLSIRQPKAIQYISGM